LQNPTRWADLESHPSQNEGWGTGCIDTTHCAAKRRIATTNDWRPTTISLCCEREQHKDVNPQARHAMPVPGRNIDNDAAGFNRAMQDSRDIGEHKSQYAAGQMKASGGKLAPNEKLSGKKQEAENGGHGEPGEAALVAQRDAWHRLNRGERRLARDFAP